MCMDSSVILAVLVVKEYKAVKRMKKTRVNYGKSLKSALSKL